MLDFSRKARKRSLFTKNRLFYYQKLLLICCASCGVSFDAAYKDASNDTIEDVLT